MRIEVLDDAKDDIVTGYYFYEDKSPGLGSYFLDSIFADIDSLLLYAGIHRIVFGIITHVHKRTFPFPWHDCK